MEEMENVNEGLRLKVKETKLKTHVKCTLLCSKDNRETTIAIEKKLPNF